MQHLEYFLIAGTFIPLGVFLLLAFFGHRLGKPAASVPAILGILSSLALSTYVTWTWWWVYSPEQRAAASAAALDLRWVVLGDMPIHAGVQLDSLTVAMYFMVTLVASCIFVFSRGYMAGHSDEVGHVSKYHRFFTYLSLFAFSMLGLVISNTLFFMFMFWELVGACSYFLIGFYFDKKYASDAAIKAFVTNRVGDFGFIIGLAMVASYLGTLSIPGAAAEFTRQAAEGSGIFAASINLFGWHISGMELATFMGVCLFCGCVGKSAQVPLQVWLPDAMAGPTPVSALIHAATMVAAGVYLVARIFPLLTPQAQLIIAGIGCITLTMAALIAVVQTDIKKALAYSTLSQLGFMVFGMGVGAWVGALFHLITHAFFKAMLFLGSGQVIEGCHHVQDIRQMGGLRRKMPVTCWTFFIGVLAIAGFGVPGFNTTPFCGLGGYYSKDEILAVAYYRAYGHAEEHGHTETHEGHSDAGAAPGGLQLASWEPGAGHHEPPTRPPVLAARSVKLAAWSSEPGAPHTAHAGGTHFAGLLGGERLLHIPAWLLWPAIFTAYITPFYMLRLWWLTFMGQPRDVHVHEHAHESPLMKWPLVALAVGTFASSWWLFRDLIADGAAATVASSAQLVLPLDGHEHLIHAQAGPQLVWLVGFAWVAGFALAWLIYRRGLDLSETLLQLPGMGLVHHVLTHKFYFDEAYNVVLVAGTRLVSWICSAADRWILDYSVIENMARATRGLAMFSGRTLDAQGVDRIAEGLGRSAFDLGDLFRRMQTGRIRNYVMLSIGTAAAAIVLIVFVIPFLQAVLSPAPQTTWAG